MVRIDPKLVEALRILSKLAEKDSLPFVLIGALAPALWIDVNRSSEQRPGFRETKDADITLQVRSWEAYQRFIQVLMKNGFERREREAEHRFHYGDTEIDLIPYGRELLHGEYLVWPRSEWKMNMKGFDQVFSCPEKIALAPDLEINVVPLWLSVILKMGAYLDRDYRRDVVDITHILEHYEENGKDSRRFDVIIEGITYETSGAFLLGRDIRENANNDGISVIQTFLTLIDNPYAKPIQDVLWEERRGINEERRQYLYDLFEFLKRGLNFNS